jgi:rod shape-determining protein MreC
MWDLLQRFRGMLLAGALVAAPLVLLYAQTRLPGARGPVVGLVMDAASVVERGLLVATGGISDVLQRYVTSVASYEELLRLRREELVASARATRIRELEHENEVLRGLAGVAARLDGPRPIGARVIGRSGAPLTRLIRVDRGGYDGIERGDGVITARGVMGRVLAAGRHSSDVLLLTDPASAVDVTSQRTRARGIVRGTGEENSYRVRVEDFDRLADVRVGDALVTSGLGGGFPAGLLVGEVQHVALREDGLYQLADVRPAVDVARAETVLVLVRRDPERIPQLADVWEEPPADAGPPEERGGPAGAAAPKRPSPPAPVAPPTIEAPATPRAAPPPETLSEPSVATPAAPPVPGPEAPAPKPEAQPEAPAPKPEAQPEAPAPPPEAQPEAPAPPPEAKPKAPTPTPEEP